MKKTVRLTESQLTSMVQNIVEQNRKLMNYREIKIINAEGQSELFDVSSVEPSRSGCLFSGRFRGSYDKLYDFLFSDSRYYQTKRGENYNDGLFYFEFKCDRANNEFILYHSGTNSAIDTKVKYKLAPDAEKILSGICKCKKYGAPVDVSGSTAVDKNPLGGEPSAMNPLPVQLIDVQRNVTRMLVVNTVSRDDQGCHFYANSRDSRISGDWQFDINCGEFDKNVDLMFSSNNLGDHKLTPESQKALNDACACKSGAVKPAVTSPQPLDPNVNKRVLNPGNKITENKKPIRLTEADIADLVKRVMEEGDRFAYGTDAIRNLEKDMAPDEDVRLTDYTGELRGDVLKKKDYIIQWLRDIIHNEDWNRLGDVILYMKHRM